MVAQNKEGYVYFIKTNLFKGYKIGRAKDYKTRISSLNTSLPIEHAFEKEIIIKCRNYVQAEKDIHKFLSKYRSSQDREFFNLGTEDMKALFEHILAKKSWSIIYLSQHFKEYLEEIPSNKEIHDWILGVLSNLEEDRFIAVKNELDMYGGGSHPTFDDEYMVRIYDTDFKLYFDEIFTTFDVSRERLKQIISSSHEIRMDEGTGEIWR